jgi:glucosamine--fructose-6-phosphate aminotransferase (isomerizing)
MRVDFSLLEGGYLRDLLDQPRALRDTVACLGETRTLSAVTRDLERGVFRRVVLTGMGSSFHALHPLFLALNKAGLTALMVETSELVHSVPELLDSGTLLVAVSQSGRSVELMRLLALRDAFRIIGVTNTSDSPLAQRADATVLTEAGEEYTVSCKTYVAGLAALAWLSDVLCGGNRHQVTAEITEAASLAEAYLANWREHVCTLCEEMKSVRHLFLVGRGESLATAGTGGLILKESARIHAEGMSSAAFRHGPFELISGGGVCAVVFDGNDAIAVLNERLAEDVRQAGGQAILIGSGACIDACRLARGPNAVRPILEFLPVEMMSLALAFLSNHRPGSFGLASKVTTVE